MTKEDRAVYRDDFGYLVIEYDGRSWTKAEAWWHLVDNPPPILKREPGISAEDNPYRAGHWAGNWRWYVEYE